ncbi:MAG: ral secretion pathway protein [Acidobacteriota bacterium]|nr:ral secretion pathway protein [Acidobacteriota bacterium]
MNRLKTAAAALTLMIAVGSCASYDAYQKAKAAETEKNWDVAVQQYERGLELNPGSIQLRMAVQHAKLEASREHFEKGKTLRAAAANATGAEQYRLAQLAGTELELTVKLDSTNQYAAAELGKVVAILQEASRTADANTIDAMKKRAKKNVSKAQPPQLNPASDQPISLSFPRETSVKEIYRALGNAFGINILFDQAVKDDRIAIELRDVTAQEALERVMQAANHFYKALDDKTIIVIPDNPQARRDYEDLVIQTFYLSNGDAEQVTNVVRTMIEARNVFPLKALNAITIRDTADKVRIAEKIIEANDKAKAEVVVDVELMQIDVTKARTLGTLLVDSAGNPANSIGMSLLPNVGTVDGKPVNLPIDLSFLKNIGSSNFSFTVPNGIIANLIKTSTNGQLLANPELRISEGEKATLHIGQRIPVPVSTFNSLSTTTANGSFAPVTSYQYQDVGIKLSMEPRVHHNREVTLKLTIEVSNLAGNAPGSNPPQPIIGTRTIESTIRLKDGETNFLAGLIQRNDTADSTKIPFLGDIPILGRLFTNDARTHTATDLVLTMTPHIVRIPDITDDDVAPMWVGTSNNLSFRGVSPRIESQAGADPFTVRPTGAPNLPLADGEPGNYIQPAPAVAPATVIPGGAPNDVFKPQQPQPQPQINQPEPQVRNQSSSTTSMASASAALVSNTIDSAAAQGLSPRIGPQPVNLSIKPGEEKLWSVVGMDLDGLTATQLLMHFDPRALDVIGVSVGNAMFVDPKTPPVVTINRDAGTIKVTSSDGQPLRFTGGGDVLVLRVHGGLSGETFLVMENPNLKGTNGRDVMSSVSGGRAKVDY